MASKSYSHAHSVFDGTDVYVCTPFKLQNVINNFVEILLWLWNLWIVICGFQSKYTHYKLVACRISSDATIYNLQATMFYETGPWSDLPPHYRVWGFRKWPPFFPQTTARGRMEQKKLIFSSFFRTKCRTPPTYSPDHGLFDPAMGAS